MKTLKIIRLLSIIMLLLNIDVNAQISASDIDKMVYEEMVRQEIPGLAIGIYKKGVINFTKGYGHIDLNRTKPINTYTAFRWASISKTLTAIAALQVAEKRKDFTLNDRVVKHYPYWTLKGLDKPRKEQITIKHLLTHRSGINHYTRGTKDVKGEYNNLHSSSYITDLDKFNANSSVNIFRNEKLDFSPGAKFLYTTFGYNLLGAVIDKKTGSYTNWVQSNIKNKLGMTSLKVSNGHFYGFQKSKDGILKEAKDKDKEWVLPGGGWESNIKDLLKFAKGIVDGKLLNDTSKLWKADYRQTYKRGIYSLDGEQGFRVWHGGSHDNLRTSMYIMPNNNIAIVVAYPAEFVDRMNLTRRIVDKLGFKRPVQLKPLDTCSDGMGSSERKFVGIWRKTENNQVIIRREYTSTNFNKEWNFLKTQGYQVFDIEAYKRKDGKTVWDGVFKKAGSGFAMWRNYDYNGFKAKWDAMNSSGYRLYDLETYMVGGKRKWAGLFKRGSGKYAMWRNLSTADFQTKKASMSKIGMKLIDVEVYTSTGQLRWSGVWISGYGEYVEWGNTWGNFDRLIKAKEKVGFKLIDTERYLENGTSKWVGIWERTTQKQKRSEGLSYCKFMNIKHSAFSKEGYELIDFEVYN